MEEKEIKTKKKYLGLSPLAIIIGMIVLVSATVTYVYLGYNQDFTKTIVVTNNDGGSGSVDQTVTYSIIGSGDIGNTTINCDKTQSTCVVNSGDISLVNTGNIPRECNIVSSELTGMTVTNSLGENPITIPASGNVIFHMIYTASTEGTYEVTTNINCPTPTT